MLGRTESSRSRSGIGGCETEPLSRRVRERLSRIRAGNFGDFRSVGGGVHELRIHAGPGVRIYFGRLESSVVLFLCAGDKRSQLRDIRRAQLYWNEYRSRFDG
jgi:putative addiction module killer protein